MDRRKYLPASREKPHAHASSAGKKRISSLDRLLHPCLPIGLAASQFGGGLGGFGRRDWPTAPSASLLSVPKADKCGPGALGGAQPRDFPERFWASCLRRCLVYR